MILNSVLIIAIRVGIMGSTPVFAPSDNPASDNPSVIIRFLTFLYLPVFNFWLLLYPRYLSFDWSMDSIPLIQSISDSRNLLSLVFYLNLILLLKAVLHYYYNKCSQIKLINDMNVCAQCSHQQQHHQHSHLKHLKKSFNIKSNNNNFLYSTLEDEYYIGNNNNNNCNNNNNNNNYIYNNYNNLSTLGSGVNIGLASNALDESSYFTKVMTRMDCITMSLALMIIPFIPATNLFFYVGFVIAERILYIPSIGYCLLIAIAIESFLRHKTIRFVTSICVTILLISFSFRTIVRNIDWLSEENLYRSGIHINPPKGNHILIYFSF